MQLKKVRSHLENFNEAIQHEWLETNGLGGWSSSTLLGCNTRRYHGLLVAATQPPAERMNLVSKLDETIILHNIRYELGTNDYGNIIHPKGYQYLSSFSKGLFPEFEFECRGITLRKTIAMVQGENTTLVMYEVVEAPDPFQLELSPLLSERGYHALHHANDVIYVDAQFENGLFKTRAYEGTPEIFIKIPGSSYQHDPHWYYNFNYAVEKYRGLDYVEDLFSHGKMLVDMNEGDVLGIIISTEDPTYKDAHELFAGEILRRQLLLRNQPEDENTKLLTLAADQFIVKRSAVTAAAGEEDLKTIIAGYHWFTDWGRDTMISLPGLCLSTGRVEDARKILAAFAKSVNKGMLPNRFRDDGQNPEYNNVDGTLWFFIAIYKYLQVSDDKTFVLQELLPVLKDIIDWHYKGTRYNIHVDKDGLLFAGEKGQQLTWMDARVNDWVVTPRMGKPVEIQALWYNALCIFAELLKLNNETELAHDYETRSGIVKNSFDQLFWYSEGNYLYDVIDEGGKPDETLRPNQLFAISLPFALLTGRKAEQVLQVVQDKLYTPVGLRSLPADHPNYYPVYGGDPYKRDGSYHQGTVWSWLLGAYVDAIVKLKGNGYKAQAKQVIENFSYHLNEGCIGSVSEIFDADAPHYPRGCIAQAWGVAEILRVIKDYSIYDEEADASINTIPEKKAL